MSREHLSNDDFFLRLSELFDERRKKDHGTIYLTQKRMTYNEEQPNPPSDSDPFPDLNPPSTPLPLIIRATDGKSKSKRDDKVKLSTIVEPEALDTFFARYAEVCKLGMSALKKRDRSKAKEKLKAKKKKKGAAAAGAGEDTKKT
ncbi:signal recognition particle 14kD protein-domain-containing protein [Xylogone sp. PMI_703]|nr:signal recognition particle 14kD protein-domain-containing protein [Xylogone sp. PMI_703]